MTDPRAIDPEAETARAKRELRRLLGPYVQEHVADQLADQFIDWELGEGWRAPARPVHWRTERAPDPDAFHRGAELARRALAQARSTTETQKENTDAQEP